MMTMRARVVHRGVRRAVSAAVVGVFATIPALANAIYDAIGVRITSLPITPEKILRALREKQKQQAQGNGGVR